MFPLLLIAFGTVVLLFGKRLSVLGGAVGALLGVVLLNLFPGEPALWLQFGAVLGLGLLGFFFAAFARGIVDVVILVLGALAGAGLVLGFLNLFGIDWGIGNWLLAVVGGVAGLMLIRSSRARKNDWGMIILASLIGALLITRGVTLLIPSMRGTTLTTILLLALTVLGIIFEGSLFRGGKSAAPAAAKPAAEAPTVIKPTAQATAVPTPPAATPPAADDGPPPPSA